MIRSRKSTLDRLAVLENLILTRKRLLCKDCEYITVDRMELVRLLKLESYTGSLIYKVRKLCELLAKSKNYDIILYHCTESINLHIIEPERDYKKEYEEADRAAQIEYAEEMNAEYERHFKIKEVSV